MRRDRPAFPRAGRAAALCAAALCAAGARALPPALPSGPAAAVTSTKGAVFEVLGDRTRVLKPGDRLERFAEVLTEEGGRVGLMDFHDHRFTLAGSGHLQLLDGDAVLKRGFLRIRSGQGKRRFSVRTANAVATYGQGEGVLSYDDASGKTQLLAIDGDFALAGGSREDMAVDVGPGRFSFVHPGHDGGLPRAPVPVGASSRGKVAALFGLPAAGAQAGAQAGAGSPARLPAAARSSQDRPKAGPAKGRRARSRRPASAPRRGRGCPGGGMPVRIFGRGGPGPDPGPGPDHGGGGRLPSSSSPSPPPSPSPSPPPSPPPPAIPAGRAPASVPAAGPGGDPFENSLAKEYKKQMSHKKEVRELIDALRSYRADHSKAP